MRPQNASHNARQGVMRMGWRLVSCLLLAGCGQAPVHFFAEGQPSTLEAWQLMQVKNGVLSLNTGVVPYDLNTPLFTDYAHKLRTIWIPDGKIATYQSEQALEFPVGTIISKTFYYPLVQKGAAQHNAVLRTSPAFSLLHDETLVLSEVRLIETRLLVRREAGWEAMSYVWNREHTSATLKRSGDMLDLELVDDNGTREAFTYIVPDQNQCASCHITDNRSRQLQPIGPKARHLNREFDYVEGRENQLQHLIQLGWLQGVPDMDTLPKTPDAMESRAPLEARARAYLDVNCGHCHSRTGAAITSGLWLDASAQEPSRLGVCKAPIAAGKGSGGHRHDLEPGNADASIITFRMNSNDPAIMMPELGRSVVHQEGVALIAQWIESLEGQCDMTR